jgi:hypothetical protein
VALRERGGLPDPQQAYLTGNVENIDYFSACERRSETVGNSARNALSASPMRSAGSIASRTRLMSASM